MSNNEQKTSVLDIQNSLFDIIWTTVLPLP
jgi:hypothetical protein